MSKRKLLLADDSVTIQKVVNLTFADEGIEVIAVGDGDSAMEKIIEISPDLIMADVNMPGLTGYQICERVRGDAQRSGTPVVLLVGSFEPFDEEEARRVGADDYLTKPFQSIRQLVNKVTVLLNSGTSPNPDDVNTAEFENTIADMPAIEPNAAAEVPVVTATSSDFGDPVDDDPSIVADQPERLAFSAPSEFSLPEPEVTDAFAATQPLNEQDIRDFELVENSDAPPFVQPEPEADTYPTIEVPAYSGYSDSIEPISEPETAPESNFQEDAVHVSEDSDSSESNVAEESIPMPDVASILEADDDDILQLPPIESDFDDSEAEPSSAPTSELAVGASNAVSNDMVDAIVKQVMDRLSEKAVKEVAWEVVPQMAELIVKKMAEENLKK